MIPFLEKLFAVQTAEAHCDVPCGVYDPSTALVAAKTVLSLTKKIVDLPTPGPTSTAQDVRAHENTVTRMVTVKEEHARICKAEILILWTDFFKPQHLEMFPDLHNRIWNTAKLVSYCKQNVDPSKAEELLAAVVKIAEMFNKAVAAAKK